MIEYVTEVADSSLEGMYTTSELYRILDQSPLIILPVKLHLSFLFFDLVLIFYVVVILYGEDAGIDAEHFVLSLCCPSQGVAFSFQDGV